MNWASWSDFLAMGGYAPYVWGAFGVSAAALGLEGWLLALRRRSLWRGDALDFDSAVSHETQI